MTNGRRALNLGTARESRRVPVVPPVLVPEGQDAALNGAGRGCSGDFLLDGEEYLIMKEDEVLAVIEGHTKKKLAVIKGTTKRTQK